VARGKSTQVIMGILLVCLGIFFLLCTFGVTPRINWLILIDFWPLLLVFIGLNILLKNTRLWWLVPVLLVITLVILLFFPGLFLEPFNYRNNEYDRGFNYNSLKRTDEIKELNVDLSFSAGELFLGSARNEELLYELIFDFNHGHPGIDYHFVDETKAGYLVIKEEQNVKIFNLSSGNNCRLYLAKDMPVALKINAGAGKFNLNLTGVNVKQLTINTGAGDLNIEMGDYSSGLELNSGAASIELKLPRSVGLEIKSTGVVNKNNFEEMGLIKVKDHTYRSVNFQEARNKINVEMASAASRIDLILY
jgi:energy-coupling factor transporter transmembrane protein EcfT